MTAPNEKNKNKEFSAASGTVTSAGPEKSSFDLAETEKNTSESDKKIENDELFLASDKTISVGRESVLNDPEKAPDDFAKRVEKSIRTEFSRRLFTPFAKAITTYGLVEPGDRIAVCISGGKDSTLMAKLFQELKRHDKFPFELEFLVMDPGYSPPNRALIESNARELGIPVRIFGTDIFENVFGIEKSPCYICARMRRGHLYAEAKELGCNKIALGHHYDDVIETILMGMLYGGQVQTMMPRLKSTNFEGMELIRPMYLVREKDIIAWRDAMGLRFLRCACRFTELNAAAEETTSKRQRVKELIRMLAAEDPQIEQNIFKSVENVNLATVIEYKDRNGVRHRFDDPEDKA